MSGLPDLPAGVYRHYKGHLYLVLGYAQNATNDEGKHTYVVYVGLQMDGQPSALRMRLRRMDEFFEFVDWGGQRVPRFTYVGPEAF